MTIRTGARTRRSSRLAWLAATALTAVALPGPVLAQAVEAEAAREYEFDIPAQSLARALTAWAQATGYQMVWPQSEPASVQAPAVRGRMTAEEALARLTAGTGFTWEHAGVRTVRLRRLPARIEDDGSRVLGPVRIEGAQSTFAYSGGPVRGDGLAQLGGVRGGQDEEATGYRPNVATVGGIAPLAVEDIPRSVSVLTQEQIEKQDIRDIGDALRRLPGVAVLEEPGADLNTGAGVYSRGFRVGQVQLDGGASRPLNIIGNGMLDLGAYERVELVRGPNGVFSGASSPGGSLNLVRKRPGDSERSEITAVLGSFDRWGIQADYSTPSLNGSPFAFRGVASMSDQELFYEKGARSNALLYGILDAPLGSKARLELGMQYSDIQEDAPYSGLYRYTGGDLIDLGDYYSNFSPAWTYDNVSSASVFSRLYVDILDNLDLQVGVDYEQGKQDRQRIYPYLNFIEGSGLSIFSDASGLKDIQETFNLSFDFKLTGKGRTFGLDHSWFVAGELTESGAKPSEGFGGPYYSFSNVAELLPTLNASEPNFSAGSSIARGGSTTRSGLVIGDVISWRERLELSIAVRRYFSEVSTFQVGVNEATGRVLNIILGETIAGSGRAEPEWVPSWSLAVKPTRNLTIYGTRSEGREEVKTPKYTADGEILGPSSYENLEGGLKFATDRWLATLAYYDLVQENVAEAVFGTSCLPSNTTQTPCYRAHGATVESKGVDFELAGEIFTGLNISASYNWADVTSSQTGVNAMTRTPTEAAQLFIDWSPGFAPRTSFRAGLRYRGEVYESGFRAVYDPDTGAYIDGETYDFTEEPYLAFDLGVRHALTDAVSLDIFAENVTDERYLSTIAASGPNFPGAPRTVVATLRWKPAQRLNAPGSTTGMAPFGDPADWYAAIETGLHASGDLDAHGDGVSQDGVTPVNWMFETEDRAIALARVGYRISPRLRAELEGSFRTADFGDVGGGAAAPFGVCGASYADLGAAFDCDDANGDMASWALLLSGLYDFSAEGSRLRPFVGAGLGAARTAVDFGGKMEGIGQDTPWNHSARRHAEEGIGGDTTKVGFAYQLLAGVAYQLTGQATIDVTYRYYAIPHLGWGSYNLEGVGGYPEFGDPWPALTGRVGNFEADFEDHSITVGLRWAFGVR